MSQHRSLRATGSTGAKRNVLKRFERVALLSAAKKWKSGDRVTGLPKVRPPE
jgi:small basic protein (TIGR04137 family)